MAAAEAQRAFAAHLAKQARNIARLVVGRKSAGRQCNNT
jgi:hypothetical protein